jgi:hypothetical protein
MDSKGVGQPPPENLLAKQGDCRKLRADQMDDDRADMFLLEPNADAAIPDPISSTHCDCVAKGGSRLHPKDTKARTVRREFRSMERDQSSGIDRHEQWIGIAMPTRATMREAWYR